MTILEWLGRFVIKHDSAANWVKNDPELMDGEMVLVTTEDGETRLKVGDGAKRFSELEYLDEPLQNLVAGKVDKVPGKGLSTNDYTTAEKNKLTGIDEGATKNVVDNSVTDTGANAVSGKAVADYVARQISTITNYEGVKF